MNIQARKQLASLIFASMSRRQLGLIVHKIMEEETRIFLRKEYKVSTIEELLEHAEKTGRLSELLTEIEEFLTSQLTTFGTFPTIVEATAKFSSIALLKFLNSLPGDPTTDAPPPAEKKYTDDPSDDSEIG